MDKGLLKELALRDGVKSDLPFIFKSWLMGLRYGNETFAFIEKRHYFEVYHKVLERILENPNVFVRIACLQTDPTVILGYAVLEGERLHWVHIKPVWRNYGIAKLLVPANIKSTSHITKIGKSILKEKLPDVVFEPFL